MSNVNMVDAGDLNETQMDQEQYEVSLTTISEDIFIENITEQIEESLDPEKMMNRQSLFEYIRLNFERELERADDEDDYTAVATKLDIDLDNISRLIEEVYGFELIYSDVIQTETRLDYVEALYEFFTIDIYEKLFNLVDTFLKDNIEAYVNEISQLNDDYKENLSYRYLQQDIDNEYTPLIYHIDTVISTLTFPEMVAEDIIEMMIDEDDIGEVTTNTIMKIFLDNEFIEVSYHEPLQVVLNPAITTNKSLTKDVKISLIETYKKEG